MTIEEAIKKAIEGGFQDPALLGQPIILHRKFGVETAVKMTRAHIFSKPLFWQSLGKAMGWERKCSECGYTIRKGRKTCSTRRCGEDNLDKSRVYWHWQWLIFIDHLAEGKTAEDYFKSLN